MPEHEATEALPLVAGDHENLRDPGISRPPLGGGHIRDDERTAVELDGVRRVQVRETIAAGAAT